MQILLQPSSALKLSQESIQKRQHAKHLLHRKSHTEMARQPARLKKGSCIPLYSSRHWVLGPELSCKAQSC